MAAAGKWTDMPRGGGIYGIWAADGSRIYVGETGDLATRLLTYRAAELLGCVIEVAAATGNLCRSLRRKMEDRIITALRERGVAVVNPTNAENHTMHLRHTPEQYREYARRGLGQLSAAQRRENSRKGALALTSDQRRAARSALSREVSLRGIVAAHAILTPEQRRANGRKGAEARWRKEA